MRHVAAVLQDGRGEGRVSLNVPVKQDKVFGVVLAEYDKAPALMTDLRRDGRSS